MPLQLSLEDALQRASASSEHVAIARAGIRRAGGEQLRARAESFPQLSGSASYDRTLGSEFSALTENAPAPCPAFQLDQTAPLADRVAELERAFDCGAAGSGGSVDFSELPFGRKNNYRLGLVFSQNLFNGGRIAAQTKAAAAGRRAAEITVHSSEAQALLDVTQAYYAAALSESLVRIAEATLDQAEQTLEQVRLARQVGRQPEFDLLRAQVARDNQRPVVIRRRNEREVAYLRLRQLLDIPADTPLTLSDRLDEAALPPPERFAAAVSARRAEVEGRAVVRQAQAAFDAQRASVSIAQSQRLPNISLVSNFGLVAYPNSFPAFDDWRRNWTAGFALHLPILTGGRINGDVEVARANAQEAEARLQLTRELAILDNRTAWSDLDAAEAAWQASAGTVEQAERAYEIAQLRFREGISTQLELTDSRLQLEQARANRAQAARDLQVTRARVALLPDLPLNNAATSASSVSFTSTTTTPTVTPRTTQQTSPAAGQAR